MIKSEEYPKIHTLWKRDQHGKIIEGDYSLPECEYLAERPWAWTEKVDGMNIRLSFEHNGFRGNEHAYIAGRTDNAQIPPHLLLSLVDLLREAPFESVFPHVDTQVTLYGEGYGAKIQKGGQYLLDRCNFVLFDVRVGRWWLRRKDVRDVGTQLGLDVVPVVFVGSIPEALQTVKEGFASQWPNASPEGLVGRPTVDLFNRKGERIITKIKWRDFH